MRHLFVRLAVALCTVTGFSSCAVEHEEDGANDLGVNLGECECELKAVIWVNSSDGGVVTCQGETWSYVQGVRIFPICMDNENAGFTVSIQATGETWAEAWVIEQGPDDTPAYFLFEWLGSGAAPAGWPTTGPASEAYLPNGGTVDAIVPEAQPD